MWWCDAGGGWRWRQGVRAVAALLMAGMVVLPGCGFALRQTPPLPFQRIALVGLGDASPLGSDLRTQLAQTVQVVATPGQADVVLQVLADRRERGVVASTAAGQVRELQLRTRFEFKLTAPGGQVLIAPTELLLSRDMSYSESFALAKAQEEAGLYAAMQADIVQQVLRRLARADVAPTRPPAVGAPAASTPQR